MDLKEIEILESDINNHWYYVSKARALSILSKNLDSKIVLDVGAGSGFFSKQLLKTAGIKEAWCVDISYEKDYDAQYEKKIVRYRKNVESVNADLVLFMDVLEHVDDDVSLIKRYFDKVPKGTKFIFTVPAFSFLWSDHDVFLEHKRRYSLNELESVVRDSGLSVLSGSYFYGLVFPLAVITRLANKIFGDHRKPASQLKKHSNIANCVLKAICIFECKLFFRLNRAVGLSAFCLAEKR